MANATGGDTKPLALTSKHRIKKMRGSIRSQPGYRSSSTPDELRYGSRLSHLAEGINGFRLRVIDFENGKQLCDLEQVADTFGQVGQLNGTAGVMRGRVKGHQSTQTTGIDIVHLS